MIFKTAALLLFRKIFAPVRLILDFARIFKYRNRPDLISLFQKPNDSTAHLVKADWAKAYGPFSVSLENYLGNPFSLYYPPLSFLLLGRMGPVWFLVFEHALFIAGLACIAWMHYEPRFLWLIPYIVTSGFCSTQTIKIGRTEIAAWGIFLIGFFLFSLNHLLLPTLALALVILFHTAVAAFSILVLLMYSLWENRWEDFILVLGGALGITAFWWIPFLSNYSQFGFHRIWNTLPVWKNLWRTYIVDFRSTGLLLIFLSFFQSGEENIHYLLLPMGVYIFSLVQRKYLFHWGSLQLFVLVSACLAFLPWFNWISALVILLLLNSVREITPLRLEAVTDNGNRDKIRSLLARVPERSRIALECHPENFITDSLRWSWVVGGAFTGSGRELLSGVGFDQVDPDLVLGYEISINPGFPKEYMDYLLSETACGYVMSYSPEFRDKLREWGYAEIGELPLDPVGALPERTYTLFKTPFEVFKIIPNAPLEHRDGQIVVTAKAGQKYRLRYWYYPGWRAFQNGIHIPLSAVKDVPFFPSSPGTQPFPFHPQFGPVLRRVGGAPGMEFTALQDGEVRLQFNTLNFFLD